MAVQRNRKPTGADLIEAFDRYLDEHGEDARGRYPSFKNAQRIFGGMLRYVDWDVVSLLEEEINRILQDGRPSKPL